MILDDSQIFMPKQMIKELASMIKTNNKGECLFIDNKRCHRNDGLIFTPCMFILSKFEKN